MKNRCAVRSASALLALAAVAVTATSSLGTIITDPNDPRSFQGATVGTFAQLYFGSDTLATRTQVVTQQLLDDGLFSPAGYTAASLVATPWATGGVVTGTSTGAGPGDYSYFTPSGLGTFGAANAIDSHWIQSSGRIGDTVFDFGAAVTNAAVFPTIDHGPLPQEAIESTVYLSNDLAGPWVQATVRRVFLNGYSLGIEWDGFTYVVGTDSNAAFRYASIIHGGPGALINDGDDEINGMLGLNDVPAPGAAGLIGLGLLAASRRRR